MQYTNLSAFSKTYVHDAKYLFLGRSDVFSRHQLKNSKRKQIWLNSYVVILDSLTYPTRHSTVSTAAVREGVTSKADHDALSKKALYAFRVVTSEELLSGLSEPTAGIQVGVIGEDDGSALIQRIGRAEHSWSNGRPPDGWGFFEAGSVDESFWIGPEINPVAALWLAPEAGRWLVAEARLFVCPLDASVAYEFDDKVAEEDWKTTGEEDMVDVNNQHGSGTLYVFEGRSDPIEANSDLSVLELKPKAVFEKIPSPVSQPVSRNNDSLDSPTNTKDCAPTFATIHTISRDAITQALSWGMPNSISAEEVELKRMQGLKEYIDLKQWLLTTTGLLVGLGTISAYAVGGIEVAQGYGVGGVAGSVYLYNLQRRVDSIPRQSASQAALHDGQKQEFGDVHSVQRENWVNSGIIVNQGSRVLLVAIVAACLQNVKWSEIQIQPSQLLCGLLGFVSFKVALGLSVFRQK